jgi:hypothetical protein
MNCYYHSEKPAIGTCKSCGRGLCAECAAEGDTYLACRNRCEARAQRIDRIINDSGWISRSAGQQMGSGVAFMMLAGLLFMWMGYSWGALSWSVPGAAIGILGLLFVLRAIGAWVTYKKSRRDTT